MHMNNNSSSAANQQDNSIAMEPPLYFAQQHVWNVCFHPTNDIIACSEITGMIEVLAYNEDEVKPLIQNKELHKLSARYCTFNPTGNLLATCSEDKRLGFLDGNGKVAHIIKKAHPSPINRCRFLNDQVLVSGDDDGLVKVWDLRTAVPVFQAEEQGDTITGICFDTAVAQFEIYASSLNGTVAAYDIRQTSDTGSKLLCLSDSIDEQLNGIQLVKNGANLVAPSSQGCIYIFKRESMEHHIDKIQGQPGSVDSIIKIDENSIISGSEDGFIRGVSIYPNSILPALGQHQQQQNFPIQSLSLSHCRRFAASSSHDNSIKFYDVNQFVKNRLKVAEGGDEQIDAQLERKQSQNSSALNWQAAENSQDFEDDSDSSQSQEEMESKPKKKKKSKKVSIRTREKELKKDTVRSFFKGL